MLVNDLYSIITSCRSCDSTNLTPILDLGNHCISNFTSPGDPEPQAPLELIRCDVCSLVQLKHTVDRNYLYGDQYWYKSGINESMVMALKDIVEDAKIILLPGDYALDIGCNDGTLLSFYPDHIHKHGFEPNLILAATALKNGADTVFSDYFPSKQWKPKSHYKVITSIAQLYNTDHLNEYVSAVKHILHPEGIWIVQMQDLDGMLKSNAVDNICHEHVTYFSIGSFLYLINKHNMVISSVSYNQVNGGSVRFTVKHGDLSHYTLKQPINNHDLDTFKSNVLRLKSDTVDLLHKLKAEGKTVLGVAASTKANTLLQFYNITPDLLPAIAERSVEKIGKLTVGTHIPIISEDELQSLNPDYLLALAWHFADNFKIRYNWFHGQWIVPLPELTIGGTLYADLFSPYTKTTIGP